MGSRIACAALVVAIALEAACASMCEELAADRKAFFARRGGPAPAPHATIVVPFAVADRLIARRMSALQPIGSPITLPGRIGRFLGSVRLVPRRLTMRPAPDDHLGLRLEVDLVAGESPLLALSLDLDVRPEVEPAKGTLRVAVRADDLRQVRSSIHPGAGDRLASDIWSRLPAVTRKLVSRDQVGVLARASIDHLAGQLGSMLIDSGLLAPLGAIAELTVAIPVVPVSRLSLHSVRGSGGALAIGVYTDLPARGGVRATGVAAGGAEVVQIRMAGTALAELGNRALVTGLLPRRYDDDMRPKKDGEFTPGFAWRSGPRPLAILAWRVKSPCLRARIGARPALRAAGGRLTLGIEGGEVEEVRGAALVRARVWVKRLGADAIRFTRDTISSARITVAGSPLTGRIQRAAVEGGEVAVDLVIE